MGGGPFYQVASEVRSLSKGQPIGLIGFTQAAALRSPGWDTGVERQGRSGVLRPPDLRDYLAYHHGDRDYRYVTGHAHLDPAIIRLLSGPGNTSAYEIDAFGRAMTTSLPGRAPCISTRISRASTCIITMARTE